MTETTHTIQIKHKITGDFSNIQLSCVENNRHWKLAFKDNRFPNSTFDDINIYRCFKQANLLLQQDGWLPLCNGARSDAGLSGALAENLSGKMIYLGKEIKPIFDYSDENTIRILNQTDDINYDIRETNFQQEQISTEALADRFEGCFLGLATGDALGTTLEFKPRGTFEPITDLIGGGPFNLSPGQWTDDTSMALCLAFSLLRPIKSGENAFDPKNQLELYLKWRDEGYMSSTGSCFDIGNTIAYSLSEFEKTDHELPGPTTAPDTAGNGSIMRLAPIPLHYFNSYKDTLHYAALSSKTTHGADEAVGACLLLASVIHNLLNGKEKEEALLSHDLPTNLPHTIIELAQGNYREKGYNEIHGLGYVIASLEAALWCFLNGNNFRECTLLAANLGDDADTTAAICGQMAGAYYGANGIPKEWKDKIHNGYIFSRLSGALLTKSLNLKKDSP